MNYPDSKYVKDICRVGHGEQCCRYLTMAPSGWSCEKLTGMGRMIDQRVAHGKMTARGDNCPGKDARHE